MTSQQSFQIPQAKSSEGPASAGLRLRGLTILDFLLIGLFALLLFGYAGFSGRPLTMHEARLPECAREMLHRGDWLLPTSGGRPWLERPPLPHWCVIAAMKLSGHDDRVWVVRLPSTIAGTVTVLLTAWMAGRLFGRTAGIVSGLMLATSYEFYVYACQAEDDIYLAALVALGMALFVRAELLPGSPQRIGRFGFVSGRPWTVLGFFTVLGLTNLTKGPLLGLVFYLGGPVGVFLLFRSWVTRTLQLIARYFWLWGLLVTIALTVAWPAWAYHNYPDVLQNFKYDYGGRMNSAYTELNEPWYYYAYELPTTFLPWSVVLLVAAGWRWIEFRRGHRATLLPGKHNLPAWLMVIWGIVPVLLLSVPSGKHHHYLVPFVAPWAVLAAAAGLEIVRKTTRAGVQRAPGSHETSNTRVLHEGKPALSPRFFFAGVVFLGLAYCAGQSLIAGKTDHTIDDTAFLIRARNEVPADVPLFIDAKMGPIGNLDFFRTQFYSRSSAVLLHNLSFLRDKTITAPVVYVICRQKDERILKQLGTIEQVDQSAQSHQEWDDKTRVNFGKFTLYRLVFARDLIRYPAPGQMTNLQAMERAPGPWCGPAMQ
jgi:4-amino-4-deoxy-L-arabinose transferase-like glycosyltransferase